MDIRNFLLVMQWKVHALNAVSLAQRLGRAARDAALKAIFIIFAEGKYIEDKGAEGQKKRGSDDTVVPGQPSRKARRAESGRRINTDKENRPESTPSNVDQTQPETSIASTPQQDIDTLMRERAIAYTAFYRELSAPTRGGQGTKNRGTGPDAIVRDVINAPYNGIRCRRRPLNVFYENEGLISKCIYICCFLILT